VKRDAGNRETAVPPAFSDVSSNKLRLFDPDVPQNHTQGKPMENLSHEKKQIAGNYDCNMWLPQKMKILASD
jgi:hypothetical protein